MILTAKPAKSLSIKKPTNVAGFSAMHHQQIFKSVDYANKANNWELTESTGCVPSK